MRRQQNLPRRVLRFVREHDLVRANEPLLVGVSGGPDSVCLLMILAELRKTLRMTLHVAHLNHQLRGAESDGDADYVSSLARELDIPVTVERQDVKAYQKEHRLSPEEAARKVRYEFFSRVALSLNSETVAVGHTADDQIETVLMHLVRGTGLAGLRGMQPLSTRNLSNRAKLRIARPLLEIRREETEAYCALRGLSPRSDSSNRCPNQLRNQVRSQLIPLLHQYNPDIEEALLRTTRASAADLAFIDEATSRLWGPVAREQPDGIAIDRAEFSHLHPALKRHLIRSVLERLLGDLQDIESVHVESLVEALAKTAGKRLSLPRGLAFYGDYDHGLITGDEPIPCPFPELSDEYPINVPGMTEIQGWQVRSTILEHKPVETGEQKLRALLDMDVTGRKLTVRGRRRGDRFQPLGMESAKKLQDFMVDARIPRPWRDRVPLVCSPQHIVWVVGWRIDQRVRLTPSTKRALCLEFEKP
ncbi:MAG: tRNA lysidine(34) synthetase TilS [Dehalococcoidia bacterium]